MKRTLTLLIIVLGLLSCNNTSHDHSENKLSNKYGENVNQQPDNSITQSEILETDNSVIETPEKSVIYFSDSLYSKLKLHFEEISINSFQKYVKMYEPACALDSNGFIKGKGIIFSRYCKDICESYLTDQYSHATLMLPSGFDAGIMGLLFSPSCRQFIVYSSYDGPDFMNFYEDRAEIVGFTVTRDQGLNAIKPSFEYNTSDWSIDSIIWIDENNLALKLYNGNRNSESMNLKYSYFKTSLTAHRNYLNELLLDEGR
ncbi:MAG TPA: hypothetical protein VFW78_09265 [Bacteroidia bacterium]|nr:hypothetical protein [Bacteroidia bacterium]